MHKLTSILFKNGLPPPRCVILRIYFCICRFFQGLEFLQLLKLFPNCYFVMKKIEKRKKQGKNSQFFACKNMQKYAMPLLKQWENEII